MNVSACDARLAARTAHHVFRPAGIWQCQFYVFRNAYMLSPYLAVEHYDAGSFQKYFAFAGGIGVVEILLLSVSLSANDGIPFFRE